MLKLYVRTGCPYCAAVLRKLNEEGIPYEELNVSDPNVEKELIELGGKRQTPFFHDEENNVKMYESGDIIDYLDEHYTS